MKKEDTEMMLRIFETERAGYGVIPSCARSPAFLSGIFQCAFCLPVSYPHTRHERIPGRDHLSRKSSSHKVLTEKHVLRGY